MSRDNNFDFFRIVAVLCVLYSHSFAVYGIPEPVFLQALELSYQAITYGTFGTTIFFAISGFLICASLERSNDLGSFIRNRVLRLYPAFIICTIFAIFVVGSILTRDRYYQHIANYIRDSSYFFLTDITVMQKIEPMGILDGHPISDCINCSLWTLPVEMSCYALAFCLFIFKGSARKAIIITCFFYSVMLFFFPPKYIKMQAMAHIATFFLGMFFYLYREYIFKFWVFLASISIILTFIFIRSFDDIYLPYVIALTYCTLYLGLNSSQPSGLLNRRDYSYGMYLYHFPVMQLVTRKTQFNYDYFWSYLAISLVITFILAYLSWKFIEMPALKFKVKTNGEN
ncbi:MAG TPA: hypothetical protein DIV86_06545 [Alphaproteobacteria bacterium]|nr:hypothetical protein [Alphaproteobacteria bacterium]